MPKATLSFNLPEENDDFDLARKAGHLLHVMETLDNYLRSKLKYDYTLTEEQRALYQEIRDKLTELRNES